MSSRVLLAGLLSLFLLSSHAVEARFELSWHQDDEFILSPASSGEGSVYVYLDGAKNLELDQVIELSCEHGTYAVPVIKAQMDTGVSSATRLEYFVFEKTASGYRPVKSILSVESVDRQTESVLSEPVVSDDKAVRRRQLCVYIPETNAFDQSIWPGGQ